MRRLLAILAAVVALLLAGLPASGAQRPPGNGRPTEIDVRGPHGVPRGIALRPPMPSQLAALAVLEAEIGAPVQVRYNGLTATPNHLFSYETYLTPPSAAAPEAIARDFLSARRDIFRFTDLDLGSLRLRSRATVPDIATTILLFEQQAAGLPLHHGEVLVNVNGQGRVISAGNDSFPALRVTNAETLTPAQAAIAAADSIGVRGFSPRPAGTARVLRTYGDLAPEFVAAPRFARGPFSDEIVVGRTIFPLGDTGRRAYDLMLAHRGHSWLLVIDAQTGQVLRRKSLTSHQTGGGEGVGRYGTFRPDVQDRSEAHNSAGSALAKVFEGGPTVMAGQGDFGKAPVGTPPRYASETATTGAARGFKLSQALGRVQWALRYLAPYGQVVRGIPDAQNPSDESPFGWFYLPTGTAGAEINGSNTGRASTRAIGYFMNTEARDRNLAANSPVADKSQPFAATLTPLSTPVTLPDGRVLSSVFESPYTEGNNAFASDDHPADGSSTQGIKGYAADRKFTAPYFDFTNAYATGPAAGGDPFIPPTAFPDTYPGSTAAFYYVNLLHDYLYSIGFTEPLWNFQQDNFGRGGSASDAVAVEIQDGGGTDNATFSTPADGSRPRMQMFLGTRGVFRRADGAFDFDVVAHELYHGVSNRSAGKGSSGCLGLSLVGEPGGQGEGWSDFLADTVADDDAVGEYLTGILDIAIRRMPATNFRWSYGSINGVLMPRRDALVPEVAPTGVRIPVEVHDIGEIWSTVLWDMRELMIVKEGGVFFDGTRRMGGGTSFFIGPRQVASVDGSHPIDYRESFNTGDPATVKAAEHMVRPAVVASEIAARGDRNGPQAAAVSRGARLADTLVLRGLQVGPCNPSFVDSRDAILLADRELTGGENQAIIWRAFASHGVGQLALSTSLQNPVTSSAPVVVENFFVPAGVTECEQAGPLGAPAFTASAETGAARLNVQPAAGASSYVISRSDGGTFRKIAEIPASQTEYLDQGLTGGKTYRYQVRAARNPQCVSTSNTESVTLP